MSGLLADLYSTIDSKKRQLKGLLADPVETLKLGLLNFKNDQNALLDTQAQAYPFIPRTQDQQARIPTFTRTQEQARKELADQGANMGMAAATVWHGSPQKFDKFDSSKIGTGEGAQAYGHGLYLAESPDVAQGYKTTLSPYELVKDGKQIPYEQMDAVTAGVASDIASKKGDLKAVRSMYENMANQKFGGAVARQRLAALDSMGANVGAEKGGSLYKVDLPDEAIAKMLDWDIALYKNHQSVQDALGSIGYVTTPPRGMVKGKSLKGSAIYEDMVRNGMNPSEISEKLESLGIPGIRYLDGGSRGAGDGTRNYVVFPGNEDILKILERNGQGLLD